MIQERHPSVELTRGAFHDLVLLVHAQLAAVNQVNLDKLRRSGSLLEIEKDPSLADTDVVDRVLSNY